MTAPVVQICIPADALNADVLDAVFVHAVTRRVQRIVVWNAELTVTAVDGDPHPKLVGLDEREELFVGERLEVADDQELFPVFNELREVRAEERERRVGDDDVRLL